ncbi:MAG: carbamoyl phosphate synthase small subunit [Candidatus Magasanikbacteria bacterium RIFCSPHIGHO2_01_FULL_33_34]|uniref:Carbamoyl phosphate synthase small chain n=1 Tax=Candidatus Magasanikbacteria bacterium RIFCSPHIGHO2_01_FULL_33_34 TaxID=1798671 RepID=A0A1F6LJM1_9BACT|nr:MAG: carbamoyl phosphate synthase small subunit [Candidatus Magasanikbacteria bacterium RIFCSPHIGHO2_01_FULL_33_34]OGH65503.1 MAG: carbamoyl phosphate synthase small subunit [Candidatus Magasanikbacteria bacterium RIFCSPHIGHO2_02_FULL_33_17]OGH76213.1 MAG: carbamoyl phosphate synthase small subunit [Candidatus Magasanikbacteria bacterium RIFCSPLOWO2_01_FULL_33_34]OGH81621.1 MAG: carbamoyl phosphate synthase small subunit [Candidatus Magasanikbacteria bacterium RIFCSPLOWO2_12_FULL_34_7]
MEFIESQLILKKGITFKGLSPSNQKEIYYGEVVFTTGMTGYIETLTDPSYAGEIITFTYPLIGNYGVPEKKYWESEKIHVSGIIVSEACTNWDHINGKSSLLNWLESQKVPIMTNVDTRELTKQLREYGVMPGAILPTNYSSNSQNKKLNYTNLSDQNLIPEVSTKIKNIYNQKKSNNKTIIVVDCGIKNNILRSLKELPLTIHHVPYNYDYTQEKFDAVFLSNGPGDPKVCIETIAILKKAMKLEKPIFGICLGSQILALAAGADTYKLKYGHRGQNQPCREEKTGKCFITSQNHGYAVDEKTIPKDWYINFRNLNDNSVEGISHKTLPFFSVQFHPEASPGPTDTKWLFEKFYDLI